MADATTGGANNPAKRQAKQSGGRKQMGAKAKGNKQGKQAQKTALSAGHEKLQAAVAKIGKSTDTKAKSETIREIASVWTRHASMEEDCLLPNLRESGIDVSAMEIAHDIVRLLLANLLKRDPADEHFEAIAKELEQAMQRIIALEGKGKTSIAGQARAKGVELGEDEADGGSGSEMQMREPGLRQLRMRVLVSSTGDAKEDQRQEYRQEEYRDMGDDRSRDDQGRFSSDDDDRRSSSYRRRDDDDDDRRYSRSSGRSERESSGWHGDSRGHSEAASRGWETRRHDDDDEDRNSRSSSSSSRGRSRYEDEDEDRRGSGRSHGGWFGDSEGHSRAARGQSGSAGGGSSGRSSGRQEDDDEYDRRQRMSMRRRNDDDDDRRGSGRSHGGWFGDAEGHSEASRRGWDERRDDDDDRSPPRGRR